MSDLSSASNSKPPPCSRSYSAGGTVSVSRSTVHPKSDENDDVLRDLFIPQRRSRPRSSGAWGKRRYLDYASSSCLNPLRPRQASMSSDTSPLTGGSSEISSEDPFPGVSSSTGPPSTHLSTSSLGGSIPPAPLTSDVSTRGGPQLTPSIGGGDPSSAGASKSAGSTSSSRSTTDPTLSSSSTQFPLLTSSSTRPGSSTSTSSPSGTLSILSRQAPPSQSTPSSPGDSIPTSPDTFAAGSPTTSLATPIISGSIGLSATVSMTEKIVLTTSTTLTQDSTIISLSISMTMPSLPTSIFTSPTTTTSFPPSMSFNTTSIPTTPPPSSSYTSITSLSASSPVITSFNSSISIFPPTESSSTTSEEANFTIPFPLTSRVPVHMSYPDTITLTMPLTSATFLTFTTSEHWTSALSNGQTSVYSTIIETGVLSSDPSRPNNSAFARNTGAIIGVTLACTVTVIVSVIMTFFGCRRYQRRLRSGEGDTNSTSEGSRENFLRQEADAMAADAEDGPPSSWAHQSRSLGGHGGTSTGEELESAYGYRGMGAGTVGSTEGAMMMENPGLGPVMFPTYPHEGGGTVRMTGANGDGGTSSEGARMYPPQTHANIASYPVIGADPYAYIPENTMPATGIALHMGPPSSHPGPGVTSSDDMTRLVQSSPPIHPGSGLWVNTSSNMGSPPQAFISYPYPQQQPHQTQYPHTLEQQPPHNYSYPYPNAPQAATSGGIRSTIGSNGTSDPVGDEHAVVTAVSSTSGHGHHSSDAIASSAFLGGSSSQGHLISTPGGSGSGSGNGGGGGVLTSSSGHGGGVSVGGGAMTPSSGYTFGYPRSKSNSPTTERRKNSLPPSSFVPPRTATMDSNGSGSGSSGSDVSRPSVRGLLGKLKSFSKKGKESQTEGGRDRRKSLQHFSGQTSSFGMSGRGRSMSSGESMTSRRSMSMSMSTAMPMPMPMSGMAHTSLHCPPSSLLNPPNAIPIPPPPPIARTDVSPPPPPPVPTIQYPSDPSTSMSMGNYSYSSPIDDYHHQRPQFPHHFHPDTNVAGDSLYLDVRSPPTMRSPSPVSTEASSFIEGLLNPRILPGSSNIPKKSDIPGAGGGDPGGPSPISAIQREWSTGSGGSGSILAARRLLRAEVVGFGLGTHDDVGGGSMMSLRDNVDYSRPISGAVVERMKSTTTFGTTGTEVGEKRSSGGEVGEGEEGVGSGATEGRGSGLRDQI
ncbi:hypothetical protein AN958_02212 [Leucoagaricus sp. SymC.cos]|nr:hypothetical protein AN958_02212 [Leucoagaricus sp. SymC.cos]